MIPLPTTSSHFIPFGGGLDTESQPMTAPPGAARAALNVECDLERGYIWSSGYERVDGRPQPSGATYSIIGLSSDNGLAVGNTVVGVTSAATAKVIAITAAYVVVTQVSGTFVPGETLNVGGVGKAVTSSAARENSAATRKLHATYTNLAADVYRASITAVPGSGSVLGCFTYSGTAYAIRNAEDGLSAKVYKGLGGGWSEQALGHEVYFTSGGSYEIQEGDTVTGATSAAAWPVVRVVLQSGSWAAGTAAGKLVFDVAVAYVAENLNVGTNLNVATVAGPTAEITLSPGGTFEFVKHNFGGTERKVYWVDGQNRAFEFDPTVPIGVPIDTPATTDTPTHVFVHREHLFLSFGQEFGAPTSVIHSAPGEPYIFDAILGAGEIGTGDEVTGFARLPGAQDTGALLIACRNRLLVLYGTDAENWVLNSVREEGSGAFAGSIQSIGMTLMLDDRGVVSLQTSQNFGNFASASISARIKSWLEARDFQVACSCLVRNKNQYRIFFDDGHVLCVTLGPKGVLGMSPMKLGHTPTCAWSDEVGAGNERVLFGASNGMVYEMEKGTSFDGDPITRHLAIHFDSLKSPRIEKRFRRVIVEVTGDGYAEFALAPSIGHAQDVQPTPEVFDAQTADARWDSTFVWDQATWDGGLAVPVVAELEGTAENISLVFRSRSDEYSPIRISGAMVEYTPRRRMR